MIFAFIFSSFSEGEKVTWLLNYEEAMQISQKEDRPILMVFSGSDWCKPCMLLKKDMLTSKKFEEFASGKLVLLNVDFPRMKKNRLSSDEQLHNERLAEEYNPNGIFPKILLINPGKEILGSSTASKVSPQEFISMIENWMTEK